MQVSAKVGEKKDKEGKVTPAKAPVTVEVNIPEKLEDLTKLYGADVVAAHAQGSIIISLQALMRRLIEKGSSQADIQKAASEYKPDSRTSGPKMSAFEKVSTNLDKLSPEERKQLLAKLTGAAPAAAKPAGQK